MKVIKLGDDLICDCGASHSTRNGWLAAHWGEQVKHTCTECGQVHYLQNGRVTVAKKGTPKKAAK